MLLIGGDLSIRCYLGVQSSSTVYLMVFKVPALICTKLDEGKKDTRQHMREYSGLSLEVKHCTYSHVPFSRNLKQNHTQCKRFEMKSSVDPEGKKKQIWFAANSRGHNL